MGNLAFGQSARAGPARQGCRGPVRTLARDRVWLVCAALASVRAERLHIKPWIGRGIGFDPG
ncbi:hypothetical protein D3260_01490 [Salinisphaera sp. Q1T1-3]|nr:hypothetical protein D3260_01490 [Salinisphaera sp. Q1T1-3]